MVGKDYTYFLYAEPKKLINFGIVDCSLIFMFVFIYFQIKIVFFIMFFIEKGIIWYIICLIFYSYRQFPCKKSLKELKIGGTEKTGGTEVSVSICLGHINQSWHSRQVFMALRFWFVIAIVKSRFDRYTRGWSEHQN